MSVDAERTWAESSADRWVLALSAIYLEAFDGFLEAEHNWAQRLDGGFDADRHGDMCRQILERDWEATDHDKVLEMLEWLLDEGHRTQYQLFRRVLIDNDLMGRTEDVYRAVAGFQLDHLDLDKDQLEASVAYHAWAYSTISQWESDLGAGGIAAWDVARLGHVVRLALAGGLIRVDECWPLLYRAARLARESLHSWAHFGESFLRGRLWWGQGDDPSNQSMRDATERLLSHPESPWRVLAWDTPLDLSLFDELILRAEQGEADAQYWLADLYHWGRGAPRDQGQAARWFRAAAEQGIAGAQNNLGLLYRRGHGVPQDFAQAAFWFGKSAEQGDDIAQANLGELYAEGMGVPEDHGEAAAWFLRAADQGNAKAQAHLGYLYAMGFGVSRDPVQAADWYRKAAAQDNADACMRLADSLCRDGNGASDLVEAYVLFDHAAAAGHESAAGRREEVGRRLSPRRLDQARTRTMDRYDRQ